MSNSLAVCTDNKKLQKSYPHASRSRTHHHCILVLRQDLLKVKPKFGFYEIAPGQKMLLFLS